MKLVHLFENSQYDQSSVAETKSLKKHVRVVKTGETGTIGEIRHGAYKGAPKQYTVDLDSGGNIRVSAAELRFVKDQGLAEAPIGAPLITQTGGLSGMPSPKGIDANGNKVLGTLASNVPKSYHGSMAENDPSGLMHAARHLNKEFRITADVDGVAKKFKVTAQSARTAQEKVMKRYPTAQLHNVEDITQMSETDKSQIGEVSNDLLSRYKKAAGADASRADQLGNYKRGDKRFSGIVAATVKQGTNDAKKSQPSDMTEADVNPASIVNPRTGQRWTPDELAAYRRSYAKLNPTPAPAANRFAAKRAAAARAAQYNMDNKPTPSLNTPTTIPSVGSSSTGYNASNVMKLPGMKKYNQSSTAAKTPNFSGPRGYSNVVTAFNQATKPTAPAAPKPSLAAKEPITIGGQKIMPNDPMYNKIMKGQRIPAVVAESNSITESYRRLKTKV